MNPMALIGLAVVGLLAIMIYLGSSERSIQNIEINQKKHELETDKYDKDFSNFLENKPISKPNDTEIEAKKKEISELEERKKIADLENEKRRAEIQKNLDEMAGKKE